MEEIWGLITAGWTGVTGVIDPYVNVRALTLSLIALIIAGWLYSIVHNFILDALLLLIVASSVWGLAQSINAVPQGLALFLALLVLIAGLVQSWKDAGSRGFKLLNVLLIAGVFMAILYVGSAGLPGVQLGSEIQAVLDQAGEFMGRTADAARGGADMVN